MICILVIKFTSSEHLLARTLHKTFHNGTQNMLTDWNKSQTTDLHYRNSLITEYLCRQKLLLHSTLWSIFLPFLHVLSSCPHTIKLSDLYHYVILWSGNILSQFFISIKHYLWKLSTILSCPRRSFLLRWSNILASTKHSMKVVLYWGKPSDGSHALPIHSWFISPKANVVREVLGAEGLVRETISWIANRNFNRCSGLLQPQTVHLTFILSLLIWHVYRWSSLTHGYTNPGYQVTWPGCPKFVSPQYSFLHLQF